MDKHEYAALAAALRCQRQIDEDGSEIAISRQAADVAADVIEKLAAGTHVICRAEPVAWRSGPIKVSLYNDPRDHVDYRNLELDYEASGGYGLSAERASKGGYTPLYAQEEEGNG